MDNPTKLIHARFDLIYNLAENHGVFLKRCDLIQIPDINEIVSIGGNPYRVIKRAWALPSDSEDEHMQYAYIDVQKACDFSVTIGGREY